MQAISYHPEIILAARRFNDCMDAYVVSQLVKATLKKRLYVEAAKVLVMGFTFKENCLDLLNTRVINIVRKLADYNAQVDVYDPWVTATEAYEEYRIDPVTQPQRGVYDAIIFAVGLKQF